MAALFYWDGQNWLPISTGGGGGGGIGPTGPEGPPGADGISITVSGPQPLPPTNPRKGDEWIDSSVRDADNVIVEQMPTLDPEIIPIKRLPATEPEMLVIKRLPPTPEPVIVYLQ
jgi:hypothetical protein